jgi:hypothetical protein
MASLDLSDSAKIVGDVPEQVFALTNPGKLKDLKIARTGLTLKLPKTERNCTDGLQLYLPYLFRRAGNKTDAVKDVKCPMRQPVGSSIPRSIGLYTALTRLDLNWVELTGTLPKEVGSLTNLHTIHLQNNGRLTGTLPTQLGNLNKLQYLYFHHNVGMTGTLPSQLNRMSALILLELNDNKFLRGTLPSAWAGMSSLAKL